MHGWQVVGGGGSEGHIIVCQWPPCTCGLTSSGSSKPQGTHNHNPHKHRHTLTHTRDKSTTDTNSGIYTHTGTPIYRGRGKVMATLILGVFFRVVVSSERSSSVIIDFSTKKYSTVEKSSGF